MASQLAAALVSVPCLLLTTNGTAAPTVFQGQALGGFTSTSTVASTAGQIVDFRPGMTLWIILEVNGAVGSGAASVIGSYDTTGYHGWDLELPSGNDLSFLSDQSEMTTSIHLATGVHALCMVWHADSTFGIAVDGYWEPDHVFGARAPSAASATWNAFLGGPPAQLAEVWRQPFQGRILGVATWATEATQAEAQAGTFTTGNRFVLSPSITGPAVFDFRAGRFTSLGSAPVTFAVTGVPTVTPIAEARYLTQSSDYCDGKVAEPGTDGNGHAWTVRNPYARLRAQTDATYASVEAYATMTWEEPYESVAAYVDGTYVGTALLNAGSYPPVAHAPQLATFSLGAGARKVVDFWEGPGDANDWVSQPYFRFGSYIQAVRLPVLLADGVTPANSTLLAAPARPAHRVVLVMDYAMDWFASAPASTSVVALLRKAYPADGITAHGAASLAMAELAARSDSVSSLVAELDGTSTNAVWIDLGMLDYGGPNGDSAAYYRSAYQSVVDGICAGKPGTHLYLQSPLQRVAPSSEGRNGFGNTLGDYRAVVQGIARGSCPRGCTCVYHECAAGECVSNTNMERSTGIYLTDPGLAQLAGVIATTLSGAGLL